MVDEKEYEVTDIYEQLSESKAPIVALIGGARSSKTHSLIQWHIEKFINERNKKILISRKTNPSVIMAPMELFFELLNQYNLYSNMVHNKSAQTLRYADNLLIYSGIDNPGRYLSTEFNYIWMEETIEFSMNDFRILELRLSGQVDESKNELNRISLSMNPSEEFSWVRDLENEGAEFQHSTFLDNPFLPAEYLKRIKKLKEKDPVYWKIYGLGEWASMVGLIYKPYKIIKLSEYPNTFEDEFYGLDFGYNNPMALLHIGIRDRDIYELELLYQSGLTTQDLIENMKMLIPEEKRIKPIYADSAEPDRIEAINRAGFNCQPSIKGAKSVWDSIDFVKSLGVIYSCDENVNLNREHKGYKWRPVRGGREDEFMEEPLKFRDHLKDGERYALYAHLKDTWHYEVVGDQVKTIGKRKGLTFILDGA